jgi:putative endonuclease
MTEQYHVYFVRCCDQSLYCGIAIDVLFRVGEHNVCQRGAKYTRSRRPVFLVYEGPAMDRTLAMSVERLLKKLRKNEKELLIAEGPSDLLAYLLQIGKSI